MHMDPITGFFALLISILAICSMFAVIGIKTRLDEQTVVLRNILLTTRTLIPASAEEQQLKTEYSNSELDSIEDLVKKRDFSVHGIAGLKDVEVGDIENQLIELFRKGRITQAQCERALMRVLTIAEITPPKPITKKCQFCAEAIKIEAVVCRYCGRDLPQTTIED